jgi:hypothetical protein
MITFFIELHRSSISSFNDIARVHAGRHTARAQMQAK